MRVLFKRRKLLLGAGALVLMLLAAWFEPTCVVKGWLRGEAFYEGRPTSYWSRELGRWRESAVWTSFALLALRADSGFVNDVPPQWNPFANEVLPAVTALNQAAAWNEVNADTRTMAAGKVRFVHNGANFGLFGYTRQPGFVDKVAGWFGVTLEYPDRPALLKGEPEALPVLRELLHDPDETVRGHAERALGRHNGVIDPGWSIGW